MFKGAVLRFQQILKEDDFRLPPLDPAAVSFVRSLPPPPPPPSPPALPPQGEGEERLTLVLDVDETLVMLQMWPVRTMNTIFGGFRHFLETLYRRTVPLGLLG